MRRIYSFAHGEVWWCDLRMYAVEAQLSRNEIERADKFAFDRDRFRYRVSHVGLRWLLEHRGASPAAPFSEGPHGKPYLDGFSWRFNLSHSADEALIALSPTHEVGVDIEAVKSIAYLEDLARQYFTPRELDAWFQLDRPAREDAFFALWSRKEACVKAAGWGLNLPLQRFDVGFRDLEPREVALPLPDGGFAKMTLVSLDVESGSAGALAWLM